MLLLIFSLHKNPILGSHDAHPDSPLKSIDFAKLVKNSSNSAFNVLKYNCSAWWYLDSHWTLNTCVKGGSELGVVTVVSKMLSVLVSKQLCFVTKVVWSFRSKAMYGSFTVFAVFTVGIFASEVVKMFALLNYFCPRKQVFYL